MTDGLSDAELALLRKYRRYSSFTPAQGEGWVVGKLLASHLIEEVRMPNPFSFFYSVTWQGLEALEADRQSQKKKETNMQDNNEIKPETDTIFAIFFDDGEWDSTWTLEEAYDVADQANMAYAIYEYRLHGLAASREEAELAKAKKLLSDNGYIVAKKP